MPRFDSSGANEYIADVTHDNCVDFISGCDLWPFAELNIWYHTLNCGFRVSFAGETDFPCITDDNVGGGRSYVTLESPPIGDAGYQQWVAGVKAGRSYVGDGRSHVFNFSVTQGINKMSDRELRLQGMETVRVTATVCARLQPEIDDASRTIKNASPYDRPYWHLERARIGQSREVAVELLLNGVSIKKVEIEADGTPRPVAFDLPVERSSWLALRILPSVHTNPVYVIVDDKPIRSSKRSAEWCRKAVDVCWEQKALRIRPVDKEAASAAFEHARITYDQIIGESFGTEDSIHSTPRVEPTVKPE